MDSRSIDLKSLRAALDGDIVGQQVLCAGPGHSKHDRSLAVRPAPRGGFVVYSFAGDDWRECRDHVQRLLGLSWQQGFKISPANSQHQLRTTITSDRTERPKVIWAEARDPRGTPAERYLAARKLDLPAELCGAILRYHPQCPWQDRTAACLIVAFKSFKDDDITAIHRIRVDQPERWPKVERRMLGAIAGSAIKLDPPGKRLAVAEGLESALAARQLGFGATWALGSAREFAPIDGVNELVILGEGDAASRKAAEACARLWQDQGRAVSLALPASGGDFNDLLMEAR